MNSCLPTIHLIKGLVSSAVFQKFILPNRQTLEQIAVVWEGALNCFADLFECPISEIHPHSLEHKTTCLLERPSSFARLIGIAGPGAVGKNTFIQKLGYKKVINSTTRPPRKNEVHGEDYFFESDKSFGAKASNGEFLFTQFRAGRGQYGIEKVVLESALMHAKGENRIVEENPHNLWEVSDYLQRMKSDHPFVMVYLLPPHPIFPHLVARLALRCEMDGSNFSSTLESTLGVRQVEELHWVERCIRGGMKVLILVNDDVERIASVAKKVLEYGLG